MKNSLQHSIKYGLGWLLCFGIRFLPYRPPNVEPILATTMPFARYLGSWSGFLFPFLSIVFYDAVTSGLGLWTWITSVTYGAIGFMAARYFHSRKGTPIRYAMFAAVGTLIYDGITGLTVGPLLYGQPFIEALLGQIPFTLNHLLSNVLLGALLSPLVDKWVVSNKQLEIPVLLQGKTVS